MESVGDASPDKLRQHQDLVQQIMKAPRCGRLSRKKSLSPSTVASPSSTNISQNGTKAVGVDLRQLHLGLWITDMRMCLWRDTRTNRGRKRLQLRIVLSWHPPASLKKEIGSDWPGWSVDACRFLDFYSLLTFTQTSERPYLYEILVLVGAYDADLSHDPVWKTWASTTILHYPSFCHWCENAIGEGSVKTLVDDIKLAEVLVLMIQQSSHLGCVMRFSKLFSSIVCRKICQPFLLQLHFKTKTFLPKERMEMMRLGKLTSWKDPFSRGDKTRRRKIADDPKLMKAHTSVLCRFGEQEIQADWRDSDC